MEQDLKIVRGTTQPMALEVTDANGAAYTLGTGERLIFGVKKNPKDKAPIFVKQAKAAGTAGEYTITIEPADTQALTPGRYFYDVGLGRADGYYSIIEPSGFTILPNITSKGDSGA